MPLTTLLFQLQRFQILERSAKPFLKVFLNKVANLYISFDFIYSDKLTLESLGLKEKASANYFVFPTQTAAFYSGRRALKNILTSITDQKSYSEWDIVAEKGQKPIINGYPELTFSISHTSKLAVAVVSDQFPSVGVDLIEKIQLEPTIPKTLFSKTEQDLIFKVPHDLQKYAANLFLSAKESMAKYTGQGFTVPFDTFEIRDIDVYQDSDAIFLISFRHHQQVSVIVVGSHHILACCVPAGSADQVARFLNLEILAQL